MSGDLQSVRWQKLRLIKLSNNPLCEVCERVGRITEAEEVDHILPRIERPDLTFVYSNLQSVCKDCHTEKSNAEIRERNKSNQATEIVNRKWKVDF